MELIIDKKLHKRLTKIIKNLQLNYIDPQRIICFRSLYSKARAYARIWSLPSIWQKALLVKAHYCIEVLQEKYYTLNKADQSKVLIHELLHIPKNFSGALLPHAGRRKLKINRKTVDNLYQAIKHLDN